MSWFAKQINILETFYKVITGMAVKKVDDINVEPIKYPDVYRFVLDVKLLDCPSKKCCDLYEFMQANNNAHFEDLEDNKTIKIIAEKGLDITNKNKACSKCVSIGKAKLMLNKLTLANLECSAHLKNYQDKEQKAFYIEEDVMFFGLLYNPPDEVDKLKGFLCIKTNNDKEYIVAKQNNQIRFIQLDSYLDEYSEDINYVLGTVNVPLTDFEVKIIDLERVFENDNKNKKNIYNENTDIFDNTFVNYCEILKSDETITEEYTADLRRNKSKSSKEAETKKLSFFEKIKNIPNLSFYLKFSTPFILVLIWIVVVRDVRTQEPKKKVSIL